jgi:MFS family permease
MYGLTYGPVGWALPAEVFPSSRRAKGIGLASAVNWLANFTIGVAVPPMIVGIGYGTYIFFACFCFLAAIFSYFCIPETSGKTLEQMDELFKDGLGAEDTRLKREIVSEL